MNRSSRLIVAVLSAALAITAAAGSATAAPPTTKALKPYGLAVSWPVASTRTAEPGTRLVVTLRAAGRARGGRGPAARVSLVRVAGGAGPRATLASRLLRRGTGRVTVTLPATAGATYELRLKVRGKRFASRLSVPAAAPATGGPAPKDVLPVPKDVDLPPTDHLPAPKDVDLPPVYVCSGPPRLEAVPNDAYDPRYAEVTFVNTGASVLTYTYSFTIERRTTAGDWVEVPLDGGFLAVVRELGCRDQVTYRWPIATGELGDYRLVTNTFRTADGSEALPAQVFPFAVTADAFPRLWS